MKISNDDLVSVLSNRLINKCNLDGMPDIESEDLELIAEFLVESEMVTVETLFSETVRDNYSPPARPIDKERVPGESR